MKSAQRGKHTSNVEVTNVSPSGFWILLDKRELFLPFSTFPWFQDVPIGQLVKVVRPHHEHLHWPDLDVDLAVDSIEHPDHYPLVSKARPNSALNPSARRVSKPASGGRHRTARRAGSRAIQDLDGPERQALSETSAQQGDRSSVTIFAGPCRSVVGAGPAFLSKDPLAVDHEAARSGRKP
jgi:hypothetical protein